DDWILIDDDFERDLAEKERLLAVRHAEVFAALPQAGAGAQEVLERLTEHLKRHFPQHYREPPGDLHPLDRAGRLVQEDLCLLRDGILVGASLCFPTRWRLAEKLGRPLLEIHAPVPGFADALGDPVARFFARLAPDQGVWRANWGIADDPTLF